MVAGSGATEESDEKANAPGGVVEVDVQKAADHEGIPGPITRLFVIANRGVANLVQDLILVSNQLSYLTCYFVAISRKEQHMLMFPLVQKLQFCFVLNFHSISFFNVSYFFT